VFVDGNTVTHETGYIPLNNKSILQIGKEVYFFLYPHRSRDIIPSTTSTTSAVTPRESSTAAAQQQTSNKYGLLMLRRNLLRCLVEAVKLRNNVLIENNINSDLKVSKLENLEVSTISGIVTSTVPLPPVHKPLCPTSSFPVTSPLSLVSPLSALQNKQDGGRTLLPNQERTPFPQLEVNIDDDRRTFVETVLEEEENEKEERDGVDSEMEIDREAGDSEQLDVARVLTSLASSSKSER
jgi:hypothetical protein